MYLCTAFHKMTKKIIISTSVELLRVAPADIAYVKAEGNYTNLYLVDGSSYTFSFNLQRFTELLVAQLGADAITFVRIGKSHVINRDYVLHVVPAKQQLVLASPNIANKYNLTVSKEALKEVKQMFELEL